MYKSNVIRITGGEFRGRKLRIGSVSGGELRPLLMRSREALFNLLSIGEWRIDLEGCCVADIFAGSGVLGIETLSRGSKWVSFIEYRGESCNIMRDSLEMLGVCKERYEVCNIDVWSLGLAVKSYDLIFLDLPYKDIDRVSYLAYSLIRKRWLGRDTKVVLHIESGKSAESIKGSASSVRSYGRNMLLYYDSMGSFRRLAELDT